MQCLSSIKASARAEGRTSSFKYYLSTVNLHAREWLCEFSSEKSIDGFGRGIFKPLIIDFDKTGET